ncbi:MAG TPA: 3-phosphoglycerate dehydrogenase [Proteobacteria bacterium]|nr:3-phosphoglycerate dehydrogenase [Pseudomonadota bacterium]
MSKKVLIGTKKPFAPEARDATLSLLKEAGYEALLLEGYEDPAELLAAVKEVNALIVRSDKITDEVMAAAPELKIVVRAGAGFDNVDCEAATNRGIVVMNTPGQNSNAVAELAIGMMIMAARGKYDGKSGTELRGKTLGLQAFGNVARRVAEIAINGFNMKVIAYDPFIPEEKIREAGVTPVRTLEELYQESDYLSLHIPATEETKGSVDYDLMSLMKKNAVLINTARAEVIDEDGLVKIYEEHPHFKYVSDVAPLNKDVLVVCDGDRCFFTPKKMGAQTAEANLNAGVAAARQIIGFFEDGDRKYQVN